MDPSVTQLVQAILKDGNVLIDVGANIGIETLVGARGVGASGKVFSIEPVSDLTMLLTKSLEAATVSRTSTLLTRQFQTEAWCCFVNYQQQ